ncbi:MAG: thioredoxin-disulfide reductase [Candidatus Aenigmarchaeota archaeon]|nr:thioredoxin-disulfide reductase [Candidatus Aenigmarchaeota archaeon]
MYDVIIIGGGAAGLTAAIYTTRRKLKTLVLSVDIGGQTNLTLHIENYPGYTELSGPKLMQTFEEQAKKFGAEIIFGKAAKVEKTKRGFEVRLANDEKYEGKTVIVASGKVPRTLGIPGEEKFMGRGVTTCATCDGPLYKNKKIAIIGGGNSALDAAEYMSKIASKVYLVHRRNEFRGEAILVDSVKAAKNVELVLNSMPVSINGDKFVSGLTIENVGTKKKRELDVNGVFIEIGYVADTSAVKELVKVNSKGEILVNEYCETGTEGIFAAGDITNVPFKQTVISAGQGAVAGLQAYTYLQKLEGKTAVKADWGV